MGFLTSAIKAELAADYRRAAMYYHKLSNQGSLLDRVGIFQALARCYEKLGQLTRAGYWHERAGEGYMKIPNSMMSLQERTYYALVEYRSGLQDYKSGASFQRAARHYLSMLSICLRGGKEGYSHEMLFAGHLSAKLGLWRKAAGLFNEAAKQLDKEGKRVLASELYELARSAREN